MGAADRHLCGRVRATRLARVLGYPYRCPAESALARKFKRQLFNCRPIARLCNTEPSPSPEGKWSGAPRCPDGVLSSPCRFDRSGSFREPIGLVVQ